MAKRKDSARVEHFPAWTPASEPPPENVKVLVWYRASYPGWRVAIGEVSCGHWRPEGGNGNFDDAITYWMPLPQAPGSASNVEERCTCPAKVDGHAHEADCSLAESPPVGQCRMQQGAEPDQWLDRFDTLDDAPKVDRHG